MLFSTRGTGFLSGHADGTVVRYYVADDTSMEQQVSTDGYLIDWIRLLISTRQFILYHN